MDTPQAKDVLAAIYDKLYKATKTPDLYRRLPPGNIRLLSYHGNIEGHINCRLREFAIDQLPPYVALSYTWGSPEDPKMDSPLGYHFYRNTRMITVNMRPVPVGQNLFDFLQQLQYDEGLEKWYWIDALCINQLDREEKTDQVRRMADIYEKAECVLVWLGQAYEDMEVLIEMMEKIIAYRQGELDRGRTYEEAMDIDDLLDPQQQRKLGLRDITADDWRSLGDFLNRSWFTREWTLQEVSLARKVACWCGSFKISWKSCQLIAHILDRTTPIGMAMNILTPSMGWISGNAKLSIVADMVSQDSREHIEALERQFKLMYNVGSLFDSPMAWLDYWLRHASALQCYDARDKVFGSLGIVQRLARRGKGELRLVADYTKTVEEVYLETTTSILIELGTLTPVRAVQCSSNDRLLGLPSWVSDYSSPASRLQDHNIARNAKPFNAARQTTAGFVVAGKKLHVHCHKHATVVGVGNSAYEIMKGLSFEKTAEILLMRPGRSGIDEILKATTLDNEPTHLPNGSWEELRRSFRSTLLLMTCTRLEMRRGEEDVLSEMLWQQRLADEDESRTIPSPREALALLPNYHQEKSIWFKNSLLFQQILGSGIGHRRLFLLDTGAIGLGPEGIELGDGLCIVADGGQTPFVLRKVGGKLEYEWMLIGEAYVRGIMYGEAVDQMEREGKEWETITII